MSDSEYDPTDVDGQQRDKSQREDQRRFADRVEQDDIKWLMSSKRGRRIAWKMLETAGVFRLSFNLNALQMAFNEGNRNYGNIMLTKINKFCPELYPVMTREALDDRNNDGSGNKSN